MPTLPLLPNIRIPTMFVFQGAITKFPVLIPSLEKMILVSPALTMGLLPPLDEFGNIVLLGPLMPNPVLPEMDRLLRLDAPVTPSVPPTVALPEVDRLLRLEAPVTPSVPPTVALPENVEFPLKSILRGEFNKAPAEFRLLKENP